MIFTYDLQPQYGEDPLWDEHVKFLLNIDNGMMRRYGHCFSTVLYYLFVMSFGEIGIPTTVHGKVLGAVCIIVGICFQLYLIRRFFCMKFQCSRSKPPTNSPVLQADHHDELNEAELRRIGQPAAGLHGHEAVSEGNGKPVDVLLREEVREVLL